MSRDRKRVESNGEAREFTLASMMKTTSLAGRVGLLVCWWHDDEDMLDDAQRGVELTPLLLTGETEDFDKNDWWIFFDAIGSYPHLDREADLREIADLAHDKWSGQLPTGQKTKCFDKELEIFLNEEQA